MNRSKLKKPTMSIEFSGLCSFVSNGCPEHPESMDVLLLEPNEVPYDPRLCRHHRFLVFRDFLGSSQPTVVSARAWRFDGDPSHYLGRAETSHSSIWTPNGNGKKALECSETDPGGADARQLRGLWPIDGKEVLLPGKALSGYGSVEECASFSKVVRMGEIVHTDHRDDAEQVDPRWTVPRRRSLVPSVVRLTDGRLHSILEGRFEIDFRPIGEKANPRGVIISQVVLYERFAEGKTFAVRAIDWESSIAEEIRFLRGTRLAISNLCPSDGSLVPPGKPDLAARGRSRNLVDSRPEEGGDRGFEFLAAGRR